MKKYLVLFLTVNTAIYSYGQQAKKALFVIVVTVAIV